MAVRVCALASCMMLTLVLQPAAARAQEPLDLTGAEVFSTHGTGHLSSMLDDNEETWWSTDDADLTVLPVNIFFLFPEPVFLGRLEILTCDLKGFIRLTHLEAYAQVDEGWAFLGGVEGNGQLRFEVELTPARVTLLRLRVMDTARPDHAFARIYSLRLLPPAEGAVPVPLAAAPLEQGETERVFVDAAMGRLEGVNEVSYDADKGYLGYAQAFMDTMLKKGTDIYGDTHAPMFTSILYLETREHPGVMLPAIDGQRQHDRAHFGGNLQHDIPLLEAMEHMTALTGDEKYRDGAHAYLRHFLTHCALGTPTGLWPWGEHAHCDFRTNTPGHRIHEHLGAMPLALWELAWEMSPEAVVGEADGCLNHVVNLETFEYNRHADILNPLPDPRPEGMAFLDFPRHGGFYLQTWAFAYSKTGDAKYLDWIERLMDHQERVLHHATGLLPGTSSQHADSPGLASTLSCALSMLESVPLLGEAETAARVDRLARGYLEAVARESRIAELEPRFTAHYGAGALAGSAMMYAHAYRLTGEERLLGMARAVAEKYTAVEELPRVRHMPTQVFASIINLLLDTHDLDGDSQWVEAAERYARQAIERLYYNGLFRGATELWYYESELWVSNLVYALVRLHCVTVDTDYRVPPTACQR